MQHRFLPNNILFKNTKVDCLTQPGCIFLLLMIICPEHIPSRGNYILALLLGLEPQNDNTTFNIEQNPMCDF